VPIQASPDSSQRSIFALRRALPRSIVEGMLARKFGISPKAAQRT